MTEVIAGCTTGIDTVWVRSLLKKKLPYLLESNDRKFDRIFIYTEFLKFLLFKNYHILSIDFWRIYWKNKKMYHIKTPVIDNLSKRNRAII